MCQGLHSSAIGLAGKSCGTKPFWRCFALAPLGVRSEIRFVVDNKRFDVKSQFRPGQDSTNKVAQGDAFSIPRSPVDVILTFLDDDFRGGGNLLLAFPDSVPRIGTILGLAFLNDGLWTDEGTIEEGFSHLLELLTTECHSMQSLQVDVVSQAVSCFMAVFGFPNRKTSQNIVNQPKVPLLNITRRRFKQLVYSFGISRMPRILTEFVVLVTRLGDGLIRRGQCNVVSMMRRTS